MRDFFRHLLSKEEWLIKETAWQRHNQGVRESQFALGNGYLGSRGVLEEIPYDAYPGSYIAGVYDKVGAQITEIVNLPNPINFRIIVEGEKIDVVAMTVLEHERILDMRKAFLKRRTIFLNSKKERFDYQSLRFFSRANTHIGVMQIYFMPLDNPAEITVETFVDTSVTNRGVLTEGRKRHFVVTKFANFRDCNYTAIELFEKKITVGYANYLEVRRDRTSFVTNKRMFNLKIEKNETVCFTKIFAIYTSRDIKSKNVERPTLRTLRKAIRAGFDALLDEHVRVWAKIWEISDVCIEPDREIKSALRFNIYHLLICGSETDSKVSIPARTLSGEGYRGHIFWDAEIFVLPFFIYTNPVVARNMLYYRFHTLDAARRNAQEKGFAGALFAWESADEGEDCTPTWHKDFNGRIIKIHTGEMEQHIVSDIAYAIYYYYLVTGDEEFMLRAGLEMIFETARFWASRVEYIKTKDQYHIKGVIGPDEFHINVNNDAYTNTLARWNLLVAYQLYLQYERHPSRIFRRLIKKINLSGREILLWKRISDRLKLPSKNEKNVIEAFDGYFKKKYIPIANLDQNFMPVIPEGLSYRKLHNTQFVKQANVIMLFHLFPEEYPIDVKKENFVYYDKRSLHKSSLSPSIYAILGWETGNYTKAFHYFLYSLYADLKNLHGNTCDGMHAASLGGTWQVVINGFAGVRVKDGILTFNPHLPREFKAIKFKIKYRGWVFDCLIRKNYLELFPKGGQAQIKIKIYDRAFDITANKKFIFRHSKIKSKDGLRLSREGRRKC